MQCNCFDSILGRARALMSEIFEIVLCGHFISKDPANILASRSLLSCKRCYAILIFPVLKCGSQAKCFLQFFGTSNYLLVSIGKFLDSSFCKRLSSFQQACSKRCTACSLQFVLGWFYLGFWHFSAGKSPPLQLTLESFWSFDVWFGTIAWSWCPPRSYLLRL